MNLPLKMKVFALGCRQYDLAAKVGLSESTISKVIHGRRKLSEEQKQKWADVLGCNVDDIFPESEGNC